MRHANDQRHVPGAHQRYVPIGVAAREAKPPIPGALGPEWGRVPSPGSSVPGSGRRFTRTRRAVHALGRALAGAVHWVGHAVAEYALAVGGLATLTAAAWTVSASIGLLVAGVGLFVLEWRIKGS
jgi:hypothetical protein